VCKIVVNSEYAVNKLLLAEVDLQKEWLCATKKSENKHVEGESSNLSHVHYKQSQPQPEQSGHN
jgi:hypothetical protein